MYSLTLRQAKDTLKAILYGACGQPIPEFKGWTKTITEGDKDGNITTIPNIIWFFWDSTKKPDIVLATIARVRRLNPKHDIRVIDSSNLSHFIDTSFMDRKDVSIQHKSDLIRLELLNAHGGIWCDATCIFNESFDWVHHESTSRNLDIIGYYRARDTIDDRFPILENWFLATPKNNRFIENWLKEVRNVVFLGVEKYFSEIKHRSDFSEIEQGSNRGSYHAVYFAAQIAMRETDGFSGSFRRAEDSPYLYQEAINWDREKMAAILCRIRSPSPVPPVIKLTYSNRYLIPIMQRLKLVKKNSILGNFLSETR